MSINLKKWLLALVLVSAGGCMDWSLDVPTGPLGPVDCSRFIDAAQRYPGICGLDGGVDAGVDAGPTDRDGGAIDAH